MDKVFQRALQKKQKRRNQPERLETETSSHNFAMTILNQYHAAKIVHLQVQVH